MNLDLANRRAFIKQASMATAAVSLGLNLKANIIDDTAKKFTLPLLPFAYNALEPIIDEKTMFIHHTKHHQAYVDNLNKAIATAGITSSLQDLVTNAANHNTTIRNNAGGHWNHSFFWSILQPPTENPIPDSLLAIINSTFGSEEKFKTLFKTTALQTFGSGWTWLIVANQKLKITSTPNQDNPLMDLQSTQSKAAIENGKPILALDIWEHAYYLKYQNDRSAYVDAFWNIIKWTAVEELLMAASRGNDQRY
jgi:superoxide dismutase, Fe-Mn family